VVGRLVGETVVGDFDGGIEGSGVGVVVNDEGAVGLVVGVEVGLVVTAGGDWVGLTVGCWVGTPTYIY